MSQIRLDKWLADAGVGTRSQVKEYPTSHKSCGVHPVLTLALLILLAE